MEYQEKTAFLQSEMIEEIGKLTKRFGVESNFNNQKVLRITEIDCDLCFNLNNGYISEINEEHIINQYGYYFDYDCITIHQLAEIVDVLKRTL